MPLSLSLYTTYSTVCSHVSALEVLPIKQCTFAADFALRCSGCTTTGSATTRRLLVSCGKKTQFRKANLCLEEHTQPQCLE